MCSSWKRCLPLACLLCCLAAPAWGQDRAAGDFDLQASAWSYRVVVARPLDQPPPYPLVIYHHGWGRGGLGKYELTKLARRFAQAGFLFWAPQRTPGGDLATAREIGRQALALALESPQVDQERIAVVGFSQGAALSALVALRHPRVKALGLLGFGALVGGRGPGGGGGGWLRRIEGLNYSQVACRVLLQVAGGDEMVDNDTRLVVKEGLRQAGKPCREIVYPGYRHEDLCGDGPYLDDLLGFLRKNLR
ncbi:MAG: dienelactone hydrolase family protein [Desulfarculus sp.]|nr:dienelactone hydrolase family protein [Desulfarculus sp.]